MMYLLIIHRHIISIHAPGKGSDDVILGEFKTLTISIHAPGKGSDSTLMKFILQVKISIHAPGKGSDFSILDTKQGYWIFQSTLPVKGATSFHRLTQHLPSFQSTLPVKGATAKVNKNLILFLPNIISFARI